MVKKLFIFIFLVGFLASLSFAKSKKKKVADAIESVVAEKMVSAPVAGEVCFSPDEHCDIKLVKFAEGAKTSIDVAIFDINLDQLVHTLLVKSKSIPVRVVVDARQAKGKSSLVSLLVKGGVSVRYGRQRSLFHNKFMIVDGVRVETGSFNYTYNATHGNHENMIFLAEPKVVERYKGEFNKIWAGARAD